MIKIIKPGNIDELEMTCPYCGCIYTYDCFDLLYGDGLTTYSVPYISCPTCGRRNEIQTKPINLNRIFSGDELNV